MQRFKWFFLAPALVLSACGNMSCSNEEAKGIVIGLLKENYTKVFGQLSFSIDAENIDVSLSAITTKSADARSAACFAQATYKTQKRMLPGGNAKSQIDSIYAIVKNPATVSVDYDMILTDDGQMQARVTSIH